MNTKNIDVKNLNTVPVNLIFEPKEDITAYQLALALDIIFGKRAYFKYDLPELEKTGLLKHFRVVEFKASF